MTPPRAALLLWSLLRSFSIVVWFWYTATATPVPPWAQPFFALACVDIGQIMLRALYESVVPGAPKHENTPPS